MKRPKILFLEGLNNNYGHKKLDLNLIRMISRFSELTVACPKGWFGEIQNVNLYEYNQVEIDSSKKPRLLRHYYDIKMSCGKLKVATELDRSDQYDYIVFATFHIIALPLYLRKFRGSTKKIYIMHHDSIDRITKHRLYQLIFRAYKNKVNHIVFEDFIGKHLSEGLGVKKEIIHCLPHPMILNLKKMVPIYDCVGISNSNDEEIIRELIAFERKSDVFIKKNKHVVLRSKSEKYDDGYLRVINGYLDDQEYYEYIQSAKAILIPFPSSFKYRMSATVVDAFSNNTCILGSDIPLLEFYEKKYPGICMTYSSIDQLRDLLLSDLTNDDLSDRFIKFNNEHSESKIQKCLKEILKI